MLKNSVYYLLLFSAAIMSCSTNQDGTTNETLEEPEQEIVTNEPVSSPAVCVWDKVSVRETPGDKSKWVTSLSIGESLTYFNVDSVMDKYTYSKVLLNDSKEGWARKDFLVIDAKPAVVLGDVALYSRPDLLTKTNKKFSMMDIISSIEKQEDWMSVRGKRDEGTWIEDGWVKAQHISFEPVDIATAKFAKQALAIEDEQERLESIKEIINNPDLSDSKFIADLQGLISELDASEELDQIFEDVIEEEQETESDI